VPSALAAACRSCISSQHSDLQQLHRRQVTKRGPFCPAASRQMLSAAAAGVSTHSTCQTAAATLLSQLLTVLTPISSTRLEQQQQQRTPMTVTFQAPAPAANASCTVGLVAVLPVQPPVLVARVQAALHQALIRLTAAPAPGCLSSAGGGAVGSGMGTGHDAATLAAPAAGCSVVPDRKVMQGTCASCTWWRCLLAPHRALRGCRECSAVAALPRHQIMWVIDWLFVTVEAWPSRWVVVLAQRLAACHAVARLGSCRHQ